jgi:hypothetical protein
LSLIANLSARERHWRAVGGVAVPLWGTPPTDVLSPWFVFWGWKDG